MHRQPLLRAVDAYRRRYPEEASMIQRLRTFVETEARCFDRALRVGHITGSAWLVDTAGARVLLTHHRKLNRWLQVGGHADGEANTLHVALREAQEESGIMAIEPVSTTIYDLDVHPIPARGATPAHHHYDVRYALRVTTDEPFVVSDESHALAWVDIARLADVTDDPSLLRMAHKWTENHHHRGA